MDYALFCSWLTHAGEPYITVQQLVLRAEAEFERRHALNLNVAAQKKPRWSAWLLSHAPSTKKAWKDQISSVIGDGSTFNLLAVLTQVDERRKQALAAKSVAPSPTVIDIDANPCTEHSGFRERGE